MPKHAVTFKALSKVWVRPKYGVPSLRHLYNRHFRYYSAIECRADELRVAAEIMSSGTQMVPTAAEVSGANKTTGSAVCLLWKDDVFEVRARTCWFWSLGRGPLIVF